MNKKSRICLVFIILVIAVLIVIVFNFKKAKLSENEITTEIVTEIITEISTEETTEMITETTTEEITEISSVAEIMTEQETSFYINYSVERKLYEPTDNPNTDVINRAAENEKAIKMYKEFINGQRSLKSGFNIDDIAMPTKEPDDRYDTDYAFWDCNGDGLKELHVHSARYYYILAYKDNDLFVWNTAFREPTRDYMPLNNGGFLSTSFPGFNTCYDYCMFDVNGNEIFSVSFSEERCYYDDGITHYMKYYYNHISVTKELYDALTKPIFDIGDDKIEWIKLYYNYYDGKNHDTEPLA